MMEAILFACGDPIDIDKLAQALNTEEENVLELSRTLQAKYNKEESGIHLPVSYTHLDVYKRQVYDNVACKGGDTLAAHRVALIRHGGGTDLVLLKRLFHFLQVLQKTDVVREFCGALRLSLIHISARRSP